MVLSNLHQETLRKTSIEGKRPSNYPIIIHHLWRNFLHCTTQITQFLFTDDITGPWQGAGPSKGGASIYRSFASSVPRVKLVGMAMPPWLVIVGWWMQPKFGLKHLETACVLLWTPLPLYGFMSKVGRRDLGLISRMWDRLDLRTSTGKK